MRAAEGRLGSVLHGKWELRELLGTGAMASVYLGVHRNGSRVAIKILHSELARQRELVRRFFREAYLANKVEHPSIVRVLDDDVGPDGAPFLVMELAMGKSLSDVLAHEGPFDPHRAALIGMRILDALEAAHANGIVHRDVKPANIVLLEDGSIRLLDFGVARLREGGQLAAVTREGSVLGTPAFMAPEQACGEHDQVDATTDLWAVGATLYLLLTGHTVRDDAENANQALLLAMSKPVAPIATRRPNVPAALGAVIDRAMLFDKRARWPSALAMKAALDRALKSTTDVPFTRVMHPGELALDSPARKETTPTAGGHRSASPLPLFTGPRVHSAPFRAPPPSRSGVHAPLPTFADSTGGSQKSPTTTVTPLRRARLVRGVGVAVVIATFGLTGALVMLGNESTDKRPTRAASLDSGVPVNAPNPTATLAWQPSAVLPFPSEVIPAASTAPSASQPAPAMPREPQAPSVSGAKKQAPAHERTSADPRELLERGRF